MPGILKQSSAGVVQATITKIHMAASPEGSGSGRSLPLPLLIVSTLAAIFATFFSFFLIWKQLKNYRKPTLQRYVVRLLVMVPIYSVASVISLYSLELADIIDLIRDLYEAFVIYCFFNLLIEYLGGERSLIVLLHGRKPQQHMFPVNLFLHDMDASDPYTFLALKRGVLQYVQVKPILAVATLLLKSVGKYEDGKISPSNGYTWVSFTYNVSVFLSLYCLAMFWKCLNQDLKPFRVTSKFLCVKGIIFFSFWQGLGISILVAAGIVKKVGPVYDPEYISLAIQDFMICLEMPIFALAHAYAFSHKDYIDPFAHYAARLPVYYALRDCIGMYDVFSDSLTTVRGTGYVYQTFEPSEGVIHQPLARERRSKAGLRYVQGGKGKYWLPQRGTGDIRDGTRGARHQGPFKKLRTYINDKRMQLEGHAPLLPEEADEVVHVDPDLERMEEQLQDERSPLIRRPGDAARSAVRHAGEGLDFFAQREDSDDDAESLTFQDPTDEEEESYQRSRTLNFGDYAYPNIDISREQNRKSRWEEDQDIVHRRRNKFKKGGGGPSESITDNGDAALGTTRTTTVAKGKGKDRVETKRDASKKRANGPTATEEGESSSGKDKKKPKKSVWLAWDADGDGEGDGTEASRAKDEAGKKVDKDPKTNGISPSAGAKGNKDDTGNVDGAVDEEEEEAEERDPYGAVDLVVEDFKAEERERLLERRRGDPALRAGKGARIFKKQYQPSGSTSPPTEEPADSITNRIARPSVNDKQQQPPSRGADTNQSTARSSDVTPSTASLAVQKNNDGSKTYTEPSMSAETPSGITQTQKSVDHEPQQHDLTDHQPIATTINLDKDKDFKNLDEFTFQSPHRGSGGGNGGSSGGKRGNGARDDTHHNHDTNPWA